MSERFGVHLMPAVPHTPPALICTGTAYECVLALLDSCTRKDLVKLLSDEVPAAAERVRRRFIDRIKAKVEAELHRLPPMAPVLRIAPDLPGDGMDDVITLTDVTPPLVVDGSVVPDDDDESEDDEATPLEPRDPMAGPGWGEGDGPVS